MIYNRHPYRIFLQLSPLHNQSLRIFGLLHATLQQNDYSSSSFFSQPCVLKRKSRSFNADGITMQILVVPIIIPSLIEACYECPNAIPSYALFMRSPNRSLSFKYWSYTKKDQQKKKNNNNTTIYKNLSRPTDTGSIPNSVQIGWEICGEMSAWRFLFLSRQWPWMKVKLVQTGTKVYSSVSSIIIVSSKDIG